VKLLDGKVAIITGSGRGIGRAAAELFASHGARVVVNDLDEGPAEASAAAIRTAGGEAAVCAGDVTAADFPERLIRTALDSFGRLDILVNNAGIAHIGNVEATSESDFDRIYAVNVKGAYHCLREAIPLLRRAGGGAIVNLSSIAALVGLEDRFAYSTSKGALTAMTLSVARDYVSHGIRCNCVCPARVHTPFVDGFLARNFAGREAEVFERLSRAQPVGRMGKPEEVAALVLYLCSDEAAFITGGIYPIDGGVMSLR